MNELKPNQGATRRRKRKARGPGSGNGKTAGRGYNGQRSRSGRGHLPTGFEGGQNPLYKRLPKRGFNNKIFTYDYNAFNIGRLNQALEGASASIKAASVLGRVELAALGLVKKKKLPTKILAANKDQLANLKGKTIRVNKASGPVAQVLSAAGVALEIEVFKMPARGKKKEQARVVA